MEWADLATVCEPLLSADAPFASMVRRVHAMPEVIALLKHLWETYAMLRLSATLLVRALVAQRHTTSLVTPPKRTVSTDASFDALLARHETWPESEHTRAFRTLCSDPEVREGMRALYYRSSAAQALAVMAAGLLER